MARGFGQGGGAATWRANPTRKSGGARNRILMALLAGLASVFVAVSPVASWAEVGGQSENPAPTSDSSSGTQRLAMSPRVGEPTEPPSGQDAENQDAESRGPESSGAAASDGDQSGSDGDEDNAGSDSGRDAEPEDSDHPELDDPESGDPDEEAADEAPRAQTQRMAAVPMAIPATPYLKWSVTDKDGNLVGGAVVQVQGPRKTGSTDSTGYQGVPTFTVTDCVAEPCSASGGDQDPTPGVFVVNRIGSATNDHTVTDTSRYRIRQVTAPSGYRWTTSSNPWVQIPGSGANPSSGAWQNGVYTFAPFQVETVKPICAPGNIYGISSGGQIQHIAPNGTKTNLGSTPSSGSDFNGLGIGMGGTEVYAYLRSSNATNATVWKYNTATGTWSNTNQSTGTQSVQFVAGAVSYDGGFYLGGYTTNGQQFHIWEYNPGTNAITKKGWIDTSSGAGGSTNGDMAFDSAGNLYVVRGSGTTTTIFSATYEAFTSASQGEITSSVARSQSGTVQDVNGVAFDSNAKIYLGQAKDVTYYQMPDWTPSGNFTTNLSDSTDLASCDTPPSITIQKDVVGRVAPTDQFQMQLKLASASGWNDLLGSETTAGTANGIQEEKVGPQVTARNVTYAFRETFEGPGNSSSNYVHTWSCAAYDNAGPVTDPNPGPLGSGTGTEGTVTIPEPGDLSSKKQIICTFTNSPLIAHVNITKNVLDKDGENPTPEEGWTVGANPTAKTGTVASDPASSEQQTGASGQASWTLTYNNAEASADVAISEVQKAGHKFISGSCQVTDIHGQQADPITFSSEAGGTVPDVKPGETVDCTFTNQELDNTLQLRKVVENENGGNKTAADFPLHATPTDPAGPQKPFEHEVAQSIQPGTYQIGETQQDGYELVDIVCAADGADPVTLEDGELTIDPGDLVTVCTLTNRDLPGSVEWTKVAKGTSDLLAGSEWKLVGPTGSGSAEVAITDCVAETAQECAGPDKDPAAGKFLVPGLKWGDYSLVETKAPPGYQLDETPISFSVTGSDLSVDLGAVDNAQHEGPGLPVTGGLGSHAFLIAGGILAALGALVGIPLYLRRYRQNLT